MIPPCHQAQREVLSADELVMNLLAVVARYEGTSAVPVTHEPRVAACADREVIAGDGNVISPLPARTAS